MYVIRNQRLSYFDEPYQPLVDAAHLAEGLIRSKTQIWNRIESDGQHMIYRCFKKDSEH